MKKSTTPKKLNLRAESVKQLNTGELQHIVGGDSSIPPGRCAMNLL